jgi:Mce-associated membrane protein
VTTAPSWYDVLGIAPDASADRIRAAWRAQIAALEPADPRFAVANRAAEVLLDPERRAAYDVERAVAPAEPDRDLEPDLAPDLEPASVVTRRASVPGWLVVGLAVLTAVVAGAAAYLALLVPSDRSVDEATSAARSAAERAVGPVLSYDAKHIEQSQAAGAQYLTGDYREDYDRLYDGIIAKNAPSTGTVLKAEVVRSGIVRSGEDRVQVFALVDQTRTNNAFKRPQVYRNWVTITMEKVGGDWLVAGMDT